MAGLRGQPAPESAPSAGHELLQRLADRGGMNVGLNPAETEAPFAAAAASRVLRRHITEGEGLSVLRILPQTLRELFDRGSDFLTVLTSNGQVGVSTDRAVARYG